MIEQKIVSIPYPSEEWCKAMANANRADRDFTPLYMKHMSKENLEKLIGKLRKEEKK